MVSWAWHRRPLRLLILTAVVVTAAQLAAPPPGSSVLSTSPLRIASRMIDDLGSGSLYLHVGMTAAELVIGMLLGVPLGGLVGVVVGASPRLRRALTPSLLLLYSVPLVALAPLFMLFLGIGLPSKVAFVAITVFFLTLFTGMEAAAAVSAAVVNSLASLGAERSETIRKLFLPASIGWMAQGLNVSAPLGLTAAITAEMLISTEGLGWLVRRRGQLSDVSGLVAALVFVWLLSLALQVLLRASDRYIERWRLATHV